MSTLSVTLRSETGKRLQALREQGRVPAVVYGPKDEPMSLSLSATDLEKILNKEGESSVITLSGEGVEKDVLIQDIQVHPLKGAIEHVDFYVIDRNKKIEVEVPIEFVNESPAVKTLGAVLVKVLHEVEVLTLPANIPQHLEVDISVLTDLEAVIKAKDIKLPEGVELITDPEETVAIVEEPQEETEEATAEMSIEDIEVEKKGKQEEEADSEGDNDQ